MRKTLEKLFPKTITKTEKKMRKTLEKLFPSNYRCFGLNSYSWNIYFEKKPKESVAKILKIISTVVVHLIHTKMLLWDFVNIFVKKIYFRK